MVLSKFSYFCLKYFPLNIILALKCKDLKKNQTDLCMSLKRVKLLRNYLHIIHLYTCTGCVREKFLEFFLLTLGIDAIKFQKCHCIHPLSKLPFRYEISRLRRSTTISRQQKTIATKIVCRIYFVVVVTAYFEISTFEQTAFPLIEQTVKVNAASSQQ